MVGGETSANRAANIAMASKTNKRNLKSARKGSARTRLPKPDFWESAVEKDLNRQGSSRSVLNPAATADRPPNNTAAESDQPVQEPSSDRELRKTSASIEAVIRKKTTARKQRSVELDRSRRYQDETRRPIVCLAFVVPFLLFYEVGSIWLDGDSLRSGIDQWFHQALRQLGFGELIVLPIVMIAVMIIWHHRIDDHWKIRFPVMAGMLLEAIGLGLILFWAANAINLIFSGASPAAAETVSAPANWWATMVACVGSGIYEELIFRILILVPLIQWALRLTPNRKTATLIGVVAVSLLFAAVHYNVFNPAGNQFELSTFVFRFFASIVFCILYLFRGFGIAVGAHVAYDVLTQI